MTKQIIESDEPIALVMTKIFQMADEFGKQVNDYAQVLSAYDNYTKMKAFIKEHGIDDTLVALWGKEIEDLAPSILKKDRNAVLEELNAVHEGYIISGIARDIYNFIAKIIKGVLKWIRTMLSQSRRVQAAFRSLRKKVDVVPHIDTRQLTYGGYEWKLVHNTLADNGGTLLDVPIIDDKTVGDGKFMDAFEAAIARQRDILKIRDENRLFRYEAPTHTFSKRQVQLGFTSLSAGGIENSNMLRSALNLIESNLDMVRQYEPAVQKFEKALEYLEKEYGNSSQDVMKYVQAHGTYISTYMSTVPPLIFEITAHFMDVMKQTLVTTKD